MPQENEITNKVRQATLSIQEHEEELDLDVFGLATHDIILGLPQLREHNPRIDWKSKVFTFKCCGTRSATASQPTHQQSTIVDKSNIAKQCNNAETRAYSKGSSQSRKLNSADTKTRPTDHQARGKEKSATPDIPEQYREYEHLFQEVVDDQALPKHQPWDHRIRLQEGKQPTFGPIYQLSEKEVEVLQEYLNKALAKGYIRLLESLARYLIMFVPKKDGTERLCVDYRQLNNITIKN